MADILTFPDPVLRQCAVSVAEITSEIQTHIDLLIDAMHRGPGGVGIAAPQIGVCRRIVVVDCSLARHSCKHHGQLVMINPEILTQSGQVMGREGCLSVPDWVATVPRAKKISVRYINEAGEICELMSSQFEARGIQHEIDHLDGVLFIDRVVSSRDMVRRMVDAYIETAAEAAVETTTATSLS